MGYYIYFVFLEKIYMKKKIRFGDIFDAVVSNYCFLVVVFLVSPDVLVLLIGDF
jgi:hypothetical protein